MTQSVLFYKEPILYVGLLLICGLYFVFTVWLLLNQYLFQKIKWAHVALSYLSTRFTTATLLDYCIRYGHDFGFSA